MRAPDHLIWEKELDVLLIEYRAAEYDYQREALKHRALALGLTMADLEHWTHKVKPLGGH
jgi:hypothetical protein